MHTLSIRSFRNGRRRPVVYLVFAAAALLAAAQPARADPAVAVEDPWVKSAPPMMKMHAAYLVLKNVSNKSVVLVGVSSPQYKKADIHLSKVEDGVATMTKQDQITVRPGGTFAMKPGGFHIMLMHPKKPVEPGQRIEIVLAFAEGSTVRIEAPVRRGPPHRHIH